MRLPLSFLGACLMALGLFALMLYMVAPPSAKVSQDPVSVANFVRMDGNASETASRTRQQAPQPPQPQTPQPPTPPTPQTATPNANLPALDIQLPSLASGIAVNSAPAPSLSGLAPGAPAPTPPRCAAICSNGARWSSSAWAAFSGKSGATGAAATPSPCPRTGS